MSPLRPRITPSLTLGGLVRQDEGKKENRKAIKLLLDVDEHILTSERTKVIMRVAIDLWSMRVKLSLSDQVPKSMPDHPR